MARRNQESANRFATFEQQFDKAQIAAGRKTAQKFGRKMTRERLAQLGNVSTRRQKGVLHKVTRRGSLVLLDMAPMSVPQEYGATITPENGQYLRVGLGKGRSTDPSSKKFVVKSRSGDLLLMSEGADGKATAIAVLKTRVVIKRRAASGRFATILDRNIGAYAQELAEQLIKEMDR